MKSNFTTAVLIIMLAIGGTLASKALAFRGDGDGRPGHSRGFPAEQHRGRMEAMAQVLDLTTDQQQQIKAILATIREANRPIREQLQDNKRAMRTVAKTEPLNREAIRSLAIEGGKLRAELMISRVATRKQIDALLTPEQRELKEKIRPLLKQRFGKRHMHHHGPGPGPSEPADS
jgi:periplasmic protein CpxP/Spy